MLVTSICTHLLKVINGVGGGAGEPRGETVTSSSGDETASWQIWTQKMQFQKAERREVEHSRWRKHNGQKVQGGTAFMDGKESWRKVLGLKDVRGLKDKK